MYVASTIAAGILWGIISVFLHFLTAAGLSPLQVLLLRGLFSSIIMFVYLLITNKSLLKISLKDIWMFVGTGIVSLTFFSLCYFKTIVDVGASVGVVLLYTSPIFVLIMSMILFKEKLNLRKFIALILTFAGCVLVAEIIGGGENRLSPSSFIIGLCAGFGYALYSIFSRFALKKYHSATVTFYTFLFSFLSLVPFVRINNIAQTFSTGSVILSVLGISLFCTVLPYILYTFGLSGLETGKAAILVTVEPLVGTLVGFIAWKEPVSVYKIAGIVLIFISVVMLGLADKKTSENNQ